MIQALKWAYGHLKIIFTRILYPKILEIHEKSKIAYNTMDVLPIGSKNWKGKNQNFYVHIIFWRFFTDNFYR